MFFFVKYLCHVKDVFSWTVTKRDKEKGGEGVTKEHDYNNIVTIIQSVHSRLFRREYWMLTLAINQGT